MSHYRVLRYALALPLLPPEHTVAAFDKVTVNIVDETVGNFVSYVRTT